MLIAPIFHNSYLSPKRSDSQNKPRLVLLCYNFEFFPTPLISSSSMAFISVAMPFQRAAHRQRPARLRRQLNTTTSSNLPSIAASHSYPKSPTVPDPTHRQHQLRPARSPPSLRLTIMTARRQRRRAIAPRPTH